MQIHLRQAVLTSLVTVGLGAIAVGPAMFCSPEARCFAISEWSQYSNAVSGLKLSYPKGWGIEPNPEKDCLFKISGTGESGLLGDVSLRTTDGTLSVAQSAAAFETYLFPKLSGYKKLSSVDAKFGRSNRFVGPQVDISFVIGDVKIRQRWQFFKHNDRACIIVFSAPQQAFSGLEPAFRTILASVDVDRLQAGSGALSQLPVSRVPVRESWKLVPLDAAIKEPVSFWYPEGWRVSRENQKGEVGWKITGKNKSGAEAELHLWTLQRGDLSLEQLAAMAEDEHLKPLDKYSKTSSGRRTVAGSDAIDQFSTFVADGLPGKQSVVFFTDKERFYSLSLLTIAWTQDEMRNLFDRIVSSVKLNH